MVLPVGVSPWERISRASGMVTAAAATPRTVLGRRLLKSLRLVTVASLLVGVRSGGLEGAEGSSAVLRPDCIPSSASACSTLSAVGRLPGSMSVIASSSSRSGPGNSTGICGAR